VLRARIAALGREVQASARRPAPAPTERRVEVPVLTEAHVKRLEAVFHGVDKLSERTREALAAMVTAATEALAAMRAHAAAPPVNVRTALIRTRQAGATPERILARSTAVMVSRRSARDDIRG
jgi:hypothetical protein